jgi:hypothetical protein
MANPTYEILPPAPTEAEADSAPPPRTSFFRRHATAAEDAELMPGAPQQHILARMFSLVLLIALVYALLRGADAAYFALSDSFLAPIVFSPDSDAVVASKLSLSSLTAERTNTSVRIEGNRAAIEADQKARARLEELKQTVSQSLNFASAVTSNQTSAGASELGKLARQRELLADNIASQQRYVEEMQRNLSAGLVHRADLVHEQNELNRLQLLALQNDRDRLTTEAKLEEHNLAQSSLRARHGAPGRLLTPEMLEQREQLVRIELEQLKLEGDERVKAAELGSAQAELARLDGLLVEIKARPVFRAVEARQNVAFVPYTQLDGVSAGARVYECRLWGVFACARVGTVVDLVPGEVSTQDPWGSPARGEYALLRLDDPKAARAKVLRARHAEGGLLAALSGLLAPKR